MACSVILKRQREMQLIELYNRLIEICNRIDRNYELLENML